MEQQFPFMLESILDNDFYKITMQCAVIRLFPDVKAGYNFINRGVHLFPEGFGEELQYHVNAMEDLSLTREEKQFLALRCPYLNPAYLDFLQGYRYDPAEVTIVQRGAELEVKVQGYWYRTILWEVPLLALISELFYKMQKMERISDQALVQRTESKMDVFKELRVTVAEFGTRRRHSYEVQKNVMNAMMGYSDGAFVGTSNVHLAMVYDTKIIALMLMNGLCFTAPVTAIKLPMPLP